MTLLEQRLSDIEARLKAATPGPWRCNKDFYAGEHAYIDTPAKAHVAHVQYSVGGRYAEAELIAAAPADLSFLLAALKVAREKFEEIRWSWANDAGRQCDNIAYEALAEIEQLAGKL